MRATVTRRRGTLDCRLVAVVGLAIALGGCSFAFVDCSPPRDQWPTAAHFGLQHDQCTGASWLPIADGTFALGIGAGAGYLASRGNTEDVVLAGLIVLPGLVYLASSLYGFSATNRCRSYLAGPPYPVDRGR